MNSKKHLLSTLFFVFALAISLTSCKTSIDFGGEKGNGTVVTKTRTISEKFDKIHVNSGIEIIVTQNEITSVEVEIDENIQSIITTKVENGVLIISSNANYSTVETPKVRVNLPEITGLKSSSGATIKSGNTLRSTSLTVDSSSGSETEIDVEADYISLETSSGSSIEVKGKALKAETSSSSGSQIDASELMANEVFSQTSSGGDTKVQAILSLTGKASSGGSIRYKNSPKKVEKVESSGGSVSKY